MSSISSARHLIIGQVNYPEIPFASYEPYERPYFFPESRILQFLIVKKNNDIPRSERPFIPDHPFYFIERFRRSVDSECKLADAFIRDIIGAIFVQRTFTSEQLEELSFDSGSHLTRRSD